MSDTENIITEAASEIQQKAAEQTQEIVAAVVENAAADVAAAQSLAQDIARSAIETELGKEITHSKQEIEKCQTKIQFLETTLAAVQVSLAEMQTKMEALATMQIVQQAPQNSVSLTPPQSEMTEAVEQVTEMLPGNLSENAVVESPVPQIPQKRKRFL